MVPNLNEIENLESCLKRLHYRFIAVQTMSDVESAGRALLGLIIIGVAIVIALGISYTNQNQNQKQMVAAGVSNGILANYTTNAGNVANTSGTNGNYVYYILFMALVLSVIIGVLAKKAMNK